MSANFWQIHEANRLKPHASQPASQPCPTTPVLAAVAGIPWLFSAAPLVPVWWPSQVVSEHKHLSCWEDWQQAWELNHLQKKRLGGGGWDKAPQTQKEGEHAVTVSQTWTKKTGVGGWRVCRDCLKKSWDCLKMKKKKFKCWNKWKNWATGHAHLLPWQLQLHDFRLAAMFSTVHRLSHFHHHAFLGSFVSFLFI